MRCSAGVHTCVRVHTRVYPQPSVSHMCLRTCGCMVCSAYFIVLLHACARLIDVCQCVHMFGSETGWMQHSLRSLQCQAIPSGYELLVNRLWPLYRPCILTSIAFQRSLSTSLVNVKSLLLEEPRELCLWMQEQSFGQEARPAGTAHQTSHISNFKVLYTISRVLI